MCSSSSLGCFSSSPSSYTSGSLRPRARPLKKSLWFSRGSGKAPAQRRNWSSSSLPQRPETEDENSESLILQIVTVLLLALTEQGEFVAQISHVTSIMPFHNCE